MEAPTVTRFIQHFIGGGLVDDRGGRVGDVYDPARGVVQAKVPLADEATVNRAIQAARNAFPAWQQTSLGKRAEVLFSFRELVRSHGQTFAEIVSSEHGKVVSDAGGEVARALEVIDFACSLPHMMKGEFSESVSRNVDTYSIRQPLGVCVGITPL